MPRKIKETVQSDLSTLSPMRESKVKSFQQRRSTVIRKTKETSISIEVNLDGRGKYNISTGIGFLDHMLELFSKHAKIDLTLSCTGDLHIDDHHTVEDVAIALGEAIKKALGDKVGIKRYGFAYIPMDETLVRSAIDLSGRSYLVFNAKFNRAKISDMATEMVEHFFFSLAEHLKANIHLEVLYGKNTHHKIEGLFKALAFSMKDAIQVIDNEIASTKGVI